MRNLFTVVFLLIIAFSISACGADGNLDPDRLKGYVDRFQEEVLPTKEEFRELAEKQIARLPAAEQAEARAALAETLANWPTAEEFDALVDEVATEMPTKAEWDQALDQLRKEMPGGAELSKALNDALDQLPEADELNNLVDESLNGMKKAAGETRRALEQQD